MMQRLQHAHGVGAPVDLPGRQVGVGEHQPPPGTAHHPKRHLASGDPATGEQVGHSVERLQHLPAALRRVEVEHLQQVGQEPTGGGVAVHQRRPLRRVRVLVGRQLGHGRPGGLQVGTGDPLADRRPQPVQALGALGWIEQHLDRGRQPAGRPAQGR